MTTSKPHSVRHGAYFDIEAAAARLADEYRSLEEQLETLRELNNHVIRERDERERDLERLGEQLEAVERERVDLRDALIKRPTERDMALLQEQLEAAQKALRNIAVWAEQELLHGPPELGLILGEARIVLEGSSPAKRST